MKKKNYIFSTLQFFVVLIAGTKTFLSYLIDQTTISFRSTCHLNLPTSDYILSTYSYFIDCLFIGLFIGALVLFPSSISATYCSLYLLVSQLVLYPRNTGSLPCSNIVILAELVRGGTGHGRTLVCDYSYLTSLQNLLFTTPFITYLGVFLFRLGVVVRVKSP